MTLAPQRRTIAKMVARPCKCSRPAWPEHQVLSSRLRAVGLDVETFYVPDGAEGSCIFHVTSRQRLCELCSTVPDREQVLETTGRPFGGAAFCVEARGMPEQVLVVPKVFVEPINGGYDELDGFAIEDLGNDEFPVCHGVINRDEDNLGQ